ncbi:MAG: polysaccharide pyruvyl transferase family protein [Marmoricola sp.]|nr:polysaccharide pyruvyl transferase family protein [Marmoricola sp.]
MRVLLRAGKAPDVVLGPEATLAGSSVGVFGSNSGNLLFSSSVHRAISVPGVEVVADSFQCERSPSTEALAKKISEEYDALVVPLANAFRPSFAGKLHKLAKLINLLAIPVIVPGVGAQLPVDGNPEAETDETNEATSAFVKAVLGKSATIGVRGEMTKNYLLHLGFPDDLVDVIGCPSLYDGGYGLRVDKRVPTLEADSKVVINTGQLVPGAGEFVARATAEYPNSHFVGQSHEELSLLLWGTPIAKRHPGLAASADHQLFREDRLRFFVDAKTWVDYFRDRDFAIGGRIHGNIAALLAGTPAVPLAWDSRIRELSEYHAIPFEISPSLSGGLDIKAIYDAADYTEFNRRVPENLTRYNEFLERNGLAHTHQPGKANPAYDEKIAKLSFPPPVSAPVGENATKLLLDRLRWLRQGAPEEKARTEKGFIPQFGKGGVSEQDELKDLKRDLAKTRKQLTETESALATLTKRLDKVDGGKTKGSGKSKIRAVIRKVR